MEMRSCFRDCAFLTMTCYTDEATSWAHPELEGVFVLHDSSKVTGLPSRRLAPLRGTHIPGYRAVIRLLLYLLVLGVSPAIAEADESPQTDESYSVWLFTGSEKDNPFWKLFVDFMEEATKDLGIELEVFYAEGDRNAMVGKISNVCQRANKPKAIVVHSFKFNGLNSLEVANRFKVPVFLVNAGLTDEQKQEIGEPRTKLKYWIGEMLPDDEVAGYRLANELIDEALKDPKRLDSEGRVHVIGLNGVVSDGASIQRVAGLEKAIAERSDEAVLDQVVAADWEQELAHSRCRILKRRYPDASVIWSASDHMAAGAIEAMRDRKQIPGKDVIIGGVDASPEAMELIEQGTLHATIGGHFMDGGWVAVLLHDYLRGLELNQIPTHPASQMELVTRDNLANYQATLTPSTWKRTDFRKLSRFHHPKLEEYEFGLNALANDSPTDVPSTPSREEDASKEDDRKNE